MIKYRVRYYLLILFAIVNVPVLAAPVIEIEIRDHLFYPDEIEIPVNTKVKLLIINQDNTAEEFESYELNREKVIPGGSRGVVFIGPLQAGVYPFFGEFYPKTAQGKVIVK
ncbi:MAG: cupredoxin domain-containing protein [Gammaproteobacteria bacterium]|nr:cupredoxin domain-containing protein [Gammaproteobacteria bacterium]